MNKRPTRPEPERSDLTRRGKPQPVVMNVNLRPDPLVAQALQRIESQLSRLLEQGTKMANELDRLTTEVTETHTVIDSAIALMEQLAQMIRDNRNNPAALTKLADDLDAKQKALADAIVANTPAAEEPPPDEPPQI